MPGHLPPPGRAPGRRPRSSPRTTTWTSPSTTWRSYLAERGFGFLGWNTRFRGNEAHFLLDHALAEIGVGVRWLREQAGVDRIVLLGNSGGGSLMAAYQSQAVEPNVLPVAGMRPLPAIEDLPPGDLFVALAAHSGRPEVLTAWLDPSVTDESDPLSADPALDPFNPENGPPYSADFQRRYRAAQRARNERITDWALGQLDALAGDAGPGPAVHRPAQLGRPADDRPGDRAVGPAAELVLPRRPDEGQLRRLRRRHRQHAAHLAVDVEPAHLAVHRGAAPGPDHAAVAGGARDGRRLRLRQRRPRPVRRARRAGQALEFIKADHYLQEPDGARTQAADLIAAWVDRAQLSHLVSRIP